MKSSEGNFQSHLYEHAIKANRELAEAVQGILPKLQEQKLIYQKTNQDSSEERSKTDHLVEKNVHKVVTQLSFSQFGFPYTSRIRMAKLSQVKQLQSLIPNCFINCYFLYIKTFWSTKIFGLNLSTIFLNR